MASLGSVKVGLEIENIVKLTCYRTDCQHNLLTAYGMSCNLKQVELDNEGHCMAFESFDEDVIEARRAAWVAATHVRLKKEKAEG